MPKSIPVVLANRTVRFLATPEELLQLKPYFAYQAPGYWFSWQYQQIMANGERMWDGFIQTLKHSRVATGSFLDVGPKVDKFRFQVQEDLRRWPQFTPTFTHALNQRMSGKWAFQQECIEKMMACLGGLILNATGAGKTSTVGGYFSRLLGMGCFIVNELTLLQQAHTDLSAVIGRPIGLIGRGIFKPQWITAATAQTLQLHITDKDPQWQQWFKLQEVVIIDEIHTMLNKRTEEILRAMPNLKAVFGLTATLELDKPHVRFPATAMAGPPIFRYPLHEGVEAGVLSKSVAVIVQRKAAYTDLSGWPAYDEQVADCVDRNDCMEEFVLAGFKQKHNILLLVRRPDHVKLLAKRFQHQSFGYFALHGESSSKLRVKAQKAMNEGKVRLIIASEIFSKGIDIPGLTLVIDGTGLPSKNTAKQRHGRGTRAHEGKDGLIHVDISDRGHGMTATSRSREEALRALKIPVMVVTYVPGRAEEILLTAKEKLK